MANNPNNNIIITNSQLITGIILHDLHIICSFMVSHPLYFSYVIYFTPYVIKLVSFISPLLIVTVFLSLLISTTTTTFRDSLNLGIVEIVVQVMKWNLDCGIGDECDCDFEEFEIYKIVFDCEFLIMICDRSDELGFEKLRECSVYGDRRSDVADIDLDLKKSGVDIIREISVHGCRKDDVAISDPDEDNSTLSELCRKNDVATCKSDVDKLSSVSGEQKNDVAICDSEMDKSGIVKLIEELDIFENFTAVKKVSNESEMITSIYHENLNDNSIQSSSSRSNSPSIVNSYGSKREDNEWRKTLACKLFEERHNSLGGEEGMDSLWETHDTDNSKNRNKRSTRTISFNTFDTDILDYDTDTDTEPVMSNGHLCCLQALKLSTGKMNLGMGKPNIVKITKAFKGWLNYVKKNHGKKG